MDDAVLKRLGIEDLKNLSPRQVIDLALDVVVGLTKYNNNSESKEQDVKATLELLNSGLENIDKEDFSGNGVCRHFASMVSSVFKSLKLNQESETNLQNLYCHQEIGTEYGYTYTYSQLMKGEDKNIGHA